MHQLERRDFKAALQQNSSGNFPIGVIAEYKRASPSLGDINTAVSVEEVVRQYEHMGASALSILTEPNRFKGDLSFIQRAKAVTHLPVLRKDFITTEQQVVESAEAGADAILLIVADLNFEQLQILISKAHALNLQTLVETHTAEELAITHKLTGDAAPTMIGVNSRNLSTLEIDTHLFYELKSHAPQDAFLVAESGLSVTELEPVKQLGYSAALIGSSLMKQF